MATQGLNLKIPADDGQNKRGLGGLKDVNSLPSAEVSEVNGAASSPWPRSKRKQPLLEVPDGNATPVSPRSLMSKYHPALENSPSPRSPHFFRSPRTPQTPKSPAQLKNTNVVQISPLLTPSRDSPGFSRMPSPLSKSEQITSLDMHSSHMPAPRDNSRSLSFAVELPGSLLLASQGYPQTFPPTLPPRQSKGLRSSSKTSYDSNISASDSSDSSATEASSVTTASEMSYRAAIPKLPTPPPRECHSSSPSVSSNGTPPPIPLTRMSLEELMKILPTLDAAIIANDWVPCVARRHEELKNTMQSFSETSYRGQKHISQMIQREFDRINKTIPAAEKVLHDLQDMVKKDPYHVYQDLEFARSQARLARAREEQMQAQMAESFTHHSRELEQVRTVMKKTVDVLGDFIHKNLHLAVENPNTANVEEVLQIIANNTDDGIDQIQEIPMKMLQEAEESHQETRELLETTRKCVYEQQHRLNCKERELEDYTNRFADVKAKMQKAVEDQDWLRKEASSLREQLRVQKAVTASQQLQANLAQSSRQDSETRSTISAYTATVQEQVKTLEAENSVLRTKLAESRTSEQKLMLQQRDLIQYHQSEPRSSDQQQRGRLMRIITGDKDSRAMSLIKGSSSMFSLSIPPKGAKGSLPETPSIRRSNSASKQSSAQSSRSPSAQRRSSSRDGTSLTSKLAFVSGRDSSANSPRIAMNQQQNRSNTDPLTDLPLRKFEQFVVKRKEPNSVATPAKSSTHPPLNKSLVNRFTQIPAYIHRPESSGRQSSDDRRPTHSEHESAPAPEVYFPSVDHLTPTFVPQITASPPPAEQEQRSRSGSLNTGNEIVSSELFLPRSTYSPKSTPSPRPPKGQYPRVLSGITEVSEANTVAGIPDKRVIHEAPGDYGVNRGTNCLSPSVTIADQEMYRERMRNLEKLQHEEDHQESTEFNFI